MGRGLLATAPAWVFTRSCADECHVVREYPELLSSAADRPSGWWGNSRWGDDVDPESGPDIGGIFGMVSPEALSSLQDALAFARAGLDGRVSAIGRAGFDLSRLDMPGTDSASRRQAAEMLQEVCSLKAARARGNEAGARDLTARILARPAPLSRPGLDPDDLAVWMLAVARAYQASLLLGDDVASVLEPAEITLLERLAARADMLPAYSAIFHLVLGQERLNQAARREVGGIEAAIRHFEQSLRLGGPADPARVLSLTWLATAMIQHVEITADVALLDDAVAALEEARKIAGGPTHPDWAVISSLRFRVDDRRGQAAAHLIAADGLRQRVWQVLLEDDPHVALTAARLAARQSLATAYACLTGHDPEAAIRALESGRGLMLFAAAEFSQVTDRLEEAGRVDLAERWRRRAASGEPDPPLDDLRREVLSVIAHTTDGLSSPSAAEISAALRDLDADALVYLVPATGSSAGHAVVVPSRGDPGYIRLGDGLKAEGTGRLAEYLGTLSRSPREVEPAGGPPEFGGVLDALCAWAWNAVVGPLLDEYIRFLPRPAGRRTYRLYLIPVGELALVPWHAARRPGGGYALSEAAFSLAGSARMLCRTAKLAPVSPRPVALVVGDPDTGGVTAPLRGARAEAYAVHESYYRAGRYVGTRPNGTPSRWGPGTAHQVRDWLAGDELGAGGVLHLACHGVVETGSGAIGAHLVLADGETLAADEIVPLLARQADRRIALVVLAACHTGVSAYGYDEAYSLGTAFLTGGARTVVSTQWAVPDETTSVLMFMFHHFLMDHRLSAWEALRRAQLWMLDPGRTPPPAMPSALRRQLGEAGDALSRVEAWAGFVHLGH
ncbi:CHAT domain-containing protein [Lentzea sp. NPDC005914]|uniref:CHAT domain-containing protein n=1 Tax=Lentzea sp. NPDC005914 TaxID=3154572 RepID=UPI0033D61D94